MQGHALGHDHQGMGMQAIAGLQEEDPVRRLGFRDTRIQLLETTAAQLDTFDASLIRQLLLGTEHPDLMRRIRLAGQAVECRFQGIRLCLRIEHHSHYAWLTWPLLEAFGQQPDLRC
ncbi:hypothetical protein D3C77_337790 [compost metagenome]